MTLKFLTAKEQQGVSNYVRDRAGPSVYTHGFEAGSQFDVVIVGAGFTGLSAALALSELGTRVAVIDAHHIGWGGSGRAWGQVAASAKFMPAKVEADFPADVAARINEAGAHAPDLVFGLVDKFQMQVDAVRTGNLIAAHMPSKEAGLAATVKDLQGRGYPVELLKGSDCQAMVGSPRYRLALFDPRGGSLNPYAYAQGLAKAAIAAGAKIYEATCVENLRQNAGKWLVTTSRGELRAEQVILATNAFTSSSLYPGIGQEVFPVRAYQIISEPLSDAQRASVLPGRQSLNDTRKLYSGIRIWPDGRLQVGIDGPVFAMNGKAYVEAAIKRIEMTFPQLKGLQWGESWGGWVDMTRDEYPRLHNLASGLWAGYGFSGRGIAIGTMMGRDLASHVLSKPQDSIHPLTPVTPTSWHAFHRPMISALVSWCRIQDAVADLRFSKLGNKPFHK